MHQMTHKSILDSIPKVENLVARSIFRFGLSFENKNYFHRCRAVS